MRLRIPYVACPACNSAKVRHYATGDATRCQSWREGWPTEINWLACDDCSHVYTDGTWTPDDEDELYSVRQGHERVGADRDVYRLAFAWAVENVRRYAPAGTWLDVGCGNGHLLCAAQEYGYRPFGLERRRDLCTELALKAGLPASSADFLTYAEPADVVSLCDVLEHVRDPLAWLRHARTITTGALMISTPTCSGAYWRLLEEPNIYLAEMQHYHCFSRKVLNDLLRKAGFEPVAYHAHARYLLGGDTIALPVRD